MDIKLLKQMHHIIRDITEEEFFIVGGAVRDTLYGFKPKDYDFVLCLGSDYGDSNAHVLIEELSRIFAVLNINTKVYQSYGVNMGEEVNPTSFQAMFYSCMKVEMRNCQVDLLLSKANYISEHVQRHDCNMNMVWFDGSRICWEHGGNEPKVDTLVFHPDVAPKRINRMDIRRHELIKHEKEYL